MEVFAVNIRTGQACCLFNKSDVPSQNANNFSLEVFRAIAATFSLSAVMKELDIVAPEVEAVGPSNFPLNTAPAPAPDPGGYFHISFEFYLIAIPWLEVAGPLEDDLEEDRTRDILRLLSVIFASGRQSRHPWPGNLFKDENVCMRC